MTYQKKNFCFISPYLDLSFYSNKSFLQLSSEQSLIQGFGCIDIWGHALRRKGRRKAGEDRASAK